MELFVALIIIAALWAMAYHRLSGETWLWGLGALLLFVSLTDVIAGPLLLLIWLLAIGGAALLGHRETRRRYISKPLLKKFREVLPPMSDTEREALEAGSVWWDAELFSGRPNWEKLQSMPAPRLTKEEREFIDGPVEELCRMLDDWRITNVFVNRAIRSRQRGIPGHRHAVGGKAGGQGSVPSAASLPATCAT